MEKIKVTRLSAGYFPAELMEVTHIVSPNGGCEHTLCGYAFVDEIYETSKDKVNCPDCLKDFKEIEQLVKDFRKKIR